MGYLTGTVFASNALFYYKILLKIFTDQIWNLFWILVFIFKFDYILTRVFFLQQMDRIFFNSWLIVCQLVETGSTTTM